jgi:biopolymer transport protein ExbD
MPAVQVPEALAPVQAQEIKRPSIHIVIAKDGSLSHGDKKITPQKLTELCNAHKKKHANGALRIQAHKQTQLKHVRVVLDAAAKSDLAIVLFDTR